MKEFKETQKFNQAWVWIIAIVPIVMVLAEFSIIIYKQEKIEITDLVVFPIVIAILVLMLIWLKLIRLETFISKEFISFHYKGLMLKPKVIYWNEILSSEVIKYDPLWEYGGWGIKYSFKRGWCYNVAGDNGLRIQLKSGKSILLGTQQPDELKQYLTSND